MAVLIRALEAEDDRRSFRSGDADLDRFFHKYAGQNQFRHHVGMTYVAVEGGDILGFATLSAGELEIEDLPLGAQKRLPRYPLPILRLARLATDERARGSGVGAELMRTVFMVAWRMAGEVGCVGVVVDAKPAAAAFYERYGFEPLEVVRGALGDRPRPVTLFLELGAIPQP